MWMIRIALGLLFLVSGFGKVLSPYQNFEYAIQAYQVLPPGMDAFVAMVFPWIELFTGAFLAAGLWTPWALKAASVLFGIFVLVVGQALMRGLPLENCGCFGGWVHVDPRLVIVLDSLSLILVFLSLRHCLSAQKFSLDSWLK